MKHRMLIDLSVLRKRIQGEFVTRTLNFFWHDWEIPYTQTEYQKFREIDDPWLTANVNALSKISDAARTGKIEFFTYSELNFEWMRGRGSNVEHSPYDPFSGIPMGNVFPALERSRFASSSFFDYNKKEKLVSFVILLNKIENVHLDKLKKYINFNNFELNSLNDLDKFKKLLNCITENHYADAFHLWTAERNKIDFYLMIEKRFINAVRAASFDEFDCQSLTPAEYCELFL
jgi:hypothetical protein